MIKNRAVSLIIILLIYVLAFAGGYMSLLFFETKCPYWLSIFLADVAATVIVFMFSLIFKNASVYDPYWSVQPPVILGFLCARLYVALNALSELLGGNTGVEFGIEPGAAFLLITILIWSIRLTANWVYNFKSFEYQDWRYVMLKEKSGRAYPLINFFGIHLFPTCVVFLCILPVITLFIEGGKFSVLTFVFISISLLATIFQGIADIQMHRFRKSGSGGFIRTGLWKHSRHPNYACEILMWWGVGLACVTALGEKRWLLAGALVNTLMFIFVSIPMADKRQSKKPGFTEYKKATRMLI